MDYMASWRFKGTASRRRALPAHALHLEHTPYHTGPQIRPANVCSRKRTCPSRIALVETDRGGDVTRPARTLVAIHPGARGLKLSYRCTCVAEPSSIALLRGYGLAAGRMEGLRALGNGAKMAAWRWRHKLVSFHGLALNVNPNMDHFRLIVPCGIQDKPVGTLAALMQPVPPMSRVMDDFDKAFRDYFEVSGGSPVPEP